MTIVEALGGHNGQTIVEVLDGQPGMTIADAILAREESEEEPTSDNQEETEE